MFSRHEGAVRQRIPARSPRRRASSTTERGQLGARKLIASYEAVMSYNGEMGARAAALAVPRLSFSEFGL